MRGGGGVEEGGGRAACPGGQKENGSKGRRRRKGRREEDDAPVGTENPALHECVDSICTACKMTLVCGICERLLPAIGMPILHLPERCEHIAEQFRDLLAERNKQDQERAERGPVPLKRT